VVDVNTSKFASSPRTDRVRTRSKTAAHWYEAFRRRVRTRFLLRFVLLRLLPPDTPHKAPRHFGKLPSLRKLTSGKVDKAALAEALDEEPQS
jgi:hypothetical protein